MTTTPHDWSKDPLSEYVQSVYGNAIATFANLKKDYEPLSHINSLWMKAGEHMHNPTEENYLPVFLFHSSHNLFRAACLMAMSGQIPEACNLLRNSLEQALYSLFIKRDHPAMARLWLKREDNISRKSLFRKTFTFGNALKALEDSDSKLAHRANTIYDGLITWGAHPNPRGVLIAAIMSTPEFFEKDPAGYPKKIGEILRATYGVAVVNFNIFRIVFKERFDLIGLSDELRMLFAKLEKKFNP